MQYAAISDRRLCSKRTPPLIHVIGALQLEAPGGRAPLQRRCLIYGGGVETVARLAGANAASSCRSASAATLLAQAVARKNVVKISQFAVPHFGTCVWIHWQLSGATQSPRVDSSNASSRGKPPPKTRDFQTRSGTPCYNGAEQSLRPQAGK